jgi:toxic protein SymE
MTNADDTRVAYATYAANQTFTAEQRTVYTEDGQPTDLRVISLDEAQSYAQKEPAALARAEAEAEEKGQARFLQQKQRRYGPRGYGAKTTVPRKPKAMKAERFLTVTDLGDPSPNTPWLRLRGKWLEQAGFPVHSRVKVEISEGRLLITLEAAST